MKFVSGIIVLFVAICGLFFVLGDYKPIHKDFVKKSEAHLKAAIPLKIGSMKGRDLPLGNTEEVIRATEQILSVSEWLNREYTCGGEKKFQLYISYWEPNKEDVTRASTHTPDRCWVKNGWKNIDSKKRFDDILEVDGNKTFPAYYREYEIESPAGKIQRKVWFWFIVDGARYNYSSNDNYISNPINYVENIFRDALIGSPEQYFIRIDSETPLEQFLDNKDFMELISKLGKLILFPKNNNEIR